LTCTQCIAPPSHPVLTFVESPPMACKLLSMPLLFMKSTRLSAITSAVFFRPFFRSEVVEISRSWLTTHGIVLFFDDAGELAIWIESFHHYFSCIFAAVKEDAVNSTLLTKIVEVVVQGFHNYFLGPLHFTVINYKSFVLVIDQTTKAAVVIAATTRRPTAYLMLCIATLGISNV